MTSFNNRGLVTASTQTTGGTAYNFGYGYALDGALKSLTYPSGRQVTNTLDAAGRISTVGSVLGGVSHAYVSGVSYMPWDVPQQITLGNGVTEYTTYNSRMQPLSITSSTASSTLLTLNTWYCPGASPAADCATNNGSVVQGWTAPNATTTFRQTFGYDSLNRLTGIAEGTSWSQAYGYDAYGNRWATGTGCYSVR